jgi:tetratricopeptide (TPR) repeat protein
MSLRVKLTACNGVHQCHDGCMTWRAVLVWAVLSVPAGAVCPDPPDVEEEQSRLSAALSKAETPVEARAIQTQLWQLWTRAPDAEAQGMLDRGMALRESYDLAGSKAELDALVDYCPDYAEGYNQRAFTTFLQADYGSALADLEIVMEMNPGHVPARAGLALTLMRLGRIQAAQGVLREAVRGNPWLAERALLKEPPGEEL